MSAGACEPISRIVVRELIRSPAFKQLVKDHLSAAAVEPEAAARELVLEDVEFSAAVAVSTARNATDAARSLAELGRTIQAWPEPILHALAEQLLDQLEPEAFVQAVAVWWELFERLVLSDPARRRRLDARATALVEAALDKAGRILATQPALARALMAFAARVVWAALRASLPVNRRTG